MDKTLISKVKSLLQNCNLENCEKVKSNLMTVLRPHEADEVYQHFVDVEPSYIKDVCKLNISQVLPQYNDYFNNLNDVSDIISDIADDNETFE